MFRPAVALLGFYRSNPKFLFLHLRRGAAMVRRGGLGELRDFVSAKFGMAASAGPSTEISTRLANLQKGSRVNAQAILDMLMPYADDPAVLRLVENDADRLRILQAQILKKYNLLDEDYYTRTFLNGDRSIGALEHYVRYGLYAGARPNRFFDPMEYIGNYPQIAAFGMDPIIHYGLFGWKDGYSAGSLFDSQFYVEKYPDVAESGISPLIHFLQTGVREHRTPLPDTRNQHESHTEIRSKGTIIVVSHDAGLGGAQQVARVLAQWLHTATHYQVKIVIMRGGPFAGSFAETAPTFDVSEHPEREIAVRLKRFAGEDVKAVFVNSVASGGFLQYWDEDTPTVAFIHELPKVLNLYPEKLELIKKRASTIIGGSEAVRTALHEEFGIEAERLRTVYGFIEAIEADRLVEHKDKPAAKRALNIEPGTFVVTACGMVHWRKSPEKFIEVAQQVSRRLAGPIKFLWIGGGPDQEKCEKLIAKAGLGEIISFTGYEPDILRYLRASDLFLLPSEEDPFPLVCLYAAMTLNPIICFKEAGGIPELVSKGCGKAVPFGDVEAMAAAVVDYAMSHDLRRAHGSKAREVVEHDYTITTTGPQLLHYIREAANLKPHVSVVVPNYNYARFLPERLASIGDQRFQDFEVILLDDCSTDESVSVLEAWAARRPGTRVVVNENNSGSPFAQWIRGMRLAESDLIWLAEADDSCEPHLLSALVPYFQDRNIFLSYVKSVPVDEANTVLGDYEELYLNRINEKRWSKGYVATDHEEANEGLGIANSIPNASSVVFRRFDPEADFEKTVSAMRMCGDWLFYLRAMRGGLIAYVEKPYNRHRRHSRTVTHSMEGSHRYFAEFATIREYVRSSYRLRAEVQAKIEAFTLQDLERFGISDEGQREQIIALATAKERKALPSVLYVASDFSPGGGQLFTIRLANAWMRRGGRAVLLNAQTYPDHEKVRAKIDPRIAVYNAHEPGGYFADLIARYDIDLVHSAMWWADRHVDENIQRLPHLPWVSTLHGCYETILDEPAIDLSFERRIPRMLERVDTYVHTADKNRRVFQIYGRPRSEVRIQNGVDDEPGRPLTRKELRLRQNATVLCLATRAIPEKGWFEAVEIVERLNRSGETVDLMLIGDGPAADTIRSRRPEHVRLYGQVANLQDYIAAADIGILPTTFGGESMPLILLEMMAKAKPIIATDAGEIASMLGTDNSAGGILVPLKNGTVDCDGFLKAVLLLLDKDRRKAMGQQSRRNFEANFTTKIMTENYESLYHALLSR